MSTLVVTRGLPGAGKTTKARAWINGPRPLGSASRIRLNRDNFRTMMFGGWTGRSDEEDAVTIAQHLAALNFLRIGADVVADDTNLREDVMASWLELAASVNATVEVWDLTDVPLDVCLERNMLRFDTPAFVPPEAIIGMWERYIEPLGGAS